MRTALTFVLLTAGLAHASEARCATAAKAQAAKLLAFHFGEADDRISIDGSVKVLPPLKNPANKAQSFEVLESWGSIYKARYRMRLIYARLEGSTECVLMGQEILEHASL